MRFRTIDLTGSSQVKFLLGRVQIRYAMRTRESAGPRRPRACDEAG
jgi:hypothetical protein